MQKIKELNLGHSDFKDIIENDNYFIDKSLLIKEVIKIQKSVLLLPRPRRFGKTLNLSMLKYFFDINEPENEKLFTNLKIWQTENEIKEKRGKFPVIYISFKDAQEKEWNDCYQLIINEIVKLFRQHKYLLDNDTVDKYEKQIFEQILQRNALKTDYQMSLKNLSEYLHRYHKQKVVILIDEYDTPIQAGHKTFYDEAISFMRNLLSGAFKDNKYLYKGVITGVLRVSKESIFTGLNNVSVYSVLDEEFSDKFGFTETEVKQIIQDFNVNTDYNEIKKWYNGYQFGKTKNIYNPWSILNFAVSKSKEFNTYWTNTSSDDLIKEQLKGQDANYIREDVLKLINNKTIEKDIEENFVFPDLDTDKELFWTLLIYSGYLTVINKTGRKKYEIVIPNYEIKTVFQDIIVKWLSTDIKIRRTLLDETTKHLINNEIKEFEKGFKEIIGDTFSYFDTAKNHEYVYQSYVLGLLAIIGDDYIIKSNRESGEGRYDIMLIPHDKTKYGVVIEIKQIDVETLHAKSLQEKINNAIENALSQIDKNKYYKELLDNKIKPDKIIKVPIIFAGKEPYIYPVE